MAQAPCPHLALIRRLGGNASLVRKHQTAGSPGSGASAVKFLRRLKVWCGRCRRLKLEFGGVARGRSRSRSGSSCRTNWKTPFGVKLLVTFGNVVLEFEEISLRNVWIRAITVGVFGGGTGGRSRSRGGSSCRTNWKTPFGVKLLVTFGNIVLKLEEISLRNVRMGAITVGVFGGGTGGRSWSRGGSSCRTNWKTPFGVQLLVTLGNVVLEFREI